MAKLNILTELGNLLPNELGAELQTIKHDLKKASAVAMGSAMQKLDLVSRQEYDIQVELLARTRAKISELEQKLQELQAQLNPPQ